MASFKTDGMTILMVFVGVIITATLIVSIADQVVGDTTTQTLLSTLTAPAVNSTLDITGRDLVTSTSIVNASNISQTATGVTLQDAIGTSGLKTVQLTTADTGAAFAGTSVNVTYTFNPDGFINGAGARSITNLVIIFGALAILIFAITRFIDTGSLGDFIRGK